MQNDWRITNQMRYLHGATLKKASFEASETNDHEHCEFCFKTFGEYDGMLKTGYCTLDEYRWICVNCFHDFAELFEWKIANEQP